MGRNIQLAGRLEEVLLNGNWIANTNCKSRIQPLDWKQATQKIGSLNSMAALTFHLKYYLAGIANVFRGGELEIRDKYSFDMPAITTEKDWENLKKEFIHTAEAFIEEVLQLTESQLDEVFVDAKYGTVVRNIEGVIEHSYYHLGQMSLIIKLLHAAEPQS